MLSNHSAKRTQREGLHHQLVQFQKEWTYIMTITLEWECWNVVERVVSRAEVLHICAFSPEHSRRF